MELQIMQNQWKEFCERNNAREPLKYFEEIKASYKEPKRHYHTFEGHIAQGLEVFQEFHNLCENSDLVYYSWLLHDIIYDSKAKDNEEQSARFAYHLAIKMGFPYKFAKGTHGLVLITKHIQTPKTIDEKMIVDLDLSIFGQSEEVFDEYELNIRKEYEFYPPEIYKPGRAGILKMFLDRKPLYNTPEIREKYEAKARENLQRSIDKLTQTG